MTQTLTQLLNLPTNKQASTVLDTDAVTSPTRRLLAPEAFLQAYGSPEQQGVREYQKDRFLKTAEYYFSKYIRDESTSGDNQKEEGADAGSKEGMTDNQGAEAGSKEAATGGKEGITGSEEGTTDSREGITDSREVLANSEKSGEITHKSPLPRMPVSGARKFVNPRTMGDILYKFAMMPGSQPPHVSPYQVQTPASMQMPAVAAQTALQQFAQASPPIANQPPIAGQGIPQTGLDQPGMDTSAAALPGTPGHAATNVIDQRGGLDPRGLTVDGNNAAGVRKDSMKMGSDRWDAVLGKRIEARDPDKISQEPADVIERAVNRNQTER